MGISIGVRYGVWHGAGHRSQAFRNAVTKRRQRPDATESPRQEPPRRQGVSGTRAPPKRHEPDRAVPETAWWSTGATVRSPPAATEPPALERRPRDTTQTAPCRRRHGGPPTPRSVAQPARSATRPCG